ncbi:MAG: hypothetical protein B7733_11795 [Myxococcales bacterium FL481]|nr:MAG: hypothetical protein B7733_11795 [Myxococcales bacterium FL481]
MHRLRLVSTLVLSFVTSTVSACESENTPSSEASESQTANPESQTANPEPHAFLGGDVDLADACAIEGAQRVGFIARLVDCIDLSGPCTIPTNPYLEFEGDDIDCPASGNESMIVEVDREGRFQAEAVVHLEDGGTTASCYGSEDANGQVPIDEVALDERAEVETELLADEPCPEPTR